MTAVRQAELERTALRVREHIIRMSSGGGCFIGASLSCADLLVYLYMEVLKTGPAMLDDPGRDYLFLSKGHDVPALYGTLAELGYFPVGRLQHHLSARDHVYWHPNRHLPGVEFHAGSLGHLLSVAIGVAIALTPVPDGLTANAWRYLALFVAVIVAIITENRIWTM